MKTKHWKFATRLMLICRVDTSPFLGFFEDFEATWCDHPAFSNWRSRGTGPRGAGTTASEGEKARWSHHVASKSSKNPKNGDVSTRHIIISCFLIFLTNLKTTIILLQYLHAYIQTHFFFFIYKPLTHSQSLLFGLLMFCSFF